MKILYVSGDVNLIGGIEKYNRDFLSALEKAGTTTILVERKVGGLLAKISFVLRFVVQAIIQRPEVIHCAHLHFSPVCLFLKKVLRIPFTLALYGIEIIDMQGTLRRKAVHEAEKVITISEYSKELIINQFPEVENRIIMHPSAVDGTIFVNKDKNKNLVEKYRLEDKPVILSLARLSTAEYKGQDRVLRALPKVIKKIPEVIYLIVGSGTDTRVNTILRNHPELSQNVVMAGPASYEERVDYYNLADVYILPSKFEGFGIVFIESLACGVPVIASDGYGGREGLLNGALGLVVPPDDIDAIADALIDILSNQAPAGLYERDNLRRRTLEVYGIDAWNARVKQLTESFSVHSN